MEKPWLKHYPKGVPAEIDINAYPSLAAISEACFKKYSSRPAFSCMGKTLSYADIDQGAQAFAAYLTTVLGLEKGDRVALMMPNILQYPVALHGILRAGLTVVNVNPLYTARELEHQLSDSGARAIVILENFAHVLAATQYKSKLDKIMVTSLGELLGFPKSLVVNTVVRHLKKLVPPYQLPATLSFSSALAAGKTASFSAPRLGHDDIAFLQYTGGTTGVSKGAMLTNGNMLANIAQAASWIGGEIKEAQEVILTALPLYHIFSLSANCLTFMKIGGHNILVPNARDIPSIVKELRTYPVTTITAVNTLFNALLNNKDFVGLDFTHLRLSLGGGMAVQKAVADRWRKVTGHTLIQAYGLTETAPAACMNPMTAQEFTGSIGLPLPSTDLAIRDDSGKDLPIGTPGEICIKGPQVMKGYWQRPEETDKVLSKDGWLLTGDIGVMDAQGFVSIVDRKKDMILVSGFNVYPNEVEDVVCSHPGILEAAAIGVPSEHSGEVVKIFAVRKDPKLTAEELIKFCKKELTGYKVPRLVEFRDELPKTNVGKILRRALRD